MSTLRILAGAVIVMAAAAGCSFTQRSDAPNENGKATVNITAPAPPAALVIVVGQARVRQVILPLITATARPREYLNILEAGPPPHVLASSVAPPPATVVIPGQPSATVSQGTSYQRAEARRHLQQWQTELEAGKRLESARTQAALAEWLRKLRIPAIVTNQAANLSQECATATSALTGIEETKASFGSRRVIVLYADSLDGHLPTGELTGVEVIVVTPFLASAAAADAAQVSMLRAGATWAAVLGPETTASQLDQLVSAGLSGNMTTQILSGPTLFANDSATLLQGATRVLIPLLAPLRRPGAVGIINGYASTPGKPALNERLSRDRAVAVADFLESHGVPASSLLVSGHGAANPIAPGSSAANRRVVVVIAN
jgi:outer membrane protein OmpA-like peptidoglycan-associated protein